MRTLLISLVTVVLLAGGAAAPALGDGPQTMTVGHGRVGGERWAFGLGVNFDDVVDSFLVPDMPGAGVYGDGPLGPRVPLDIVRSGRFGDRNNWEVDGVVDRTVARLRLRTTRGVTTVVTHPAPARVVRRHPRLGRVRWFVRFLPPDAKPLRLVAFGRGGRVLVRWPLN